MSETGGFSADAYAQVVHLVLLYAAGFLVVFNCCYFYYGIFIFIYGVYLFLCLSLQIYFVCLYFFNMYFLSPNLLLLSFPIYIFFIAIKKNILGNCVFFTTRE